MLPPEQQRRHGFAVVDKEAGWTSHDVVAKARGLLHNKKVGHSGTLDPDATGVLLLGVGRCTRLLRFLTVLPKTYEGELVLGVETSTLDAAGEVVARHDMSDVGEAAVQAAAARLTGELLQVPPMVSAVRVGGRRLHELARAGEEVDREPRPVRVDRFDVGLLGASPGARYRFEVQCSSGTYVRSLVADLGHALGGGAHVRTLRRTAIGSFTEAEARPVDEITVEPPAAAVRDYPQVVVDDELLAAVRHGRVLPASAFGADLAPVWAVLDGHGALVAMYERHGDERAKPAVVVAPADGGSSQDSARR